MIVKGTKQLGNFKRGVNLYIPKRSGIPVASTNTIIINGQQYIKTPNNLNITLSEYIFDWGYADVYIPLNSKVFVLSPTVGIFGNGTSYFYDQGYAYLVPPNTNINNVTDTFWTIRSWYFDIDNNQMVIYSTNTNPSTNPNFIPTSDWSPAITITAA